MENDIKEKNNINYSIVKHDKRKNEIDKKWKKLNIDKTFAESTIREINEKRENHGIKSLQLDDYLNIRAFIIAKEFLIKGEINNENLLYKNSEDLGMSLKLSNEKLKAEELVKNWYEENIDYDYKNPEELSCTNFTQMIWKNSEKFGIGYYHLNEEELKQKNQNKVIDINNIEEDNQNDYTYCYIALYYPAGNLLGEYNKNVLQEFLKNFVMFKETEIPEQEICEEEWNKNISKIKGKQNKKGLHFWNMRNKIEENEENENGYLNINEIDDDEPEVIDINEIRDDEPEVIDINEIRDEQPNKKEIFDPNEIKDDQPNKKEIFDINETE